ncbi:MAG: hypothetical protein HQL51_00730 [Magnetococcales bacterium]|nr:hypothetical protein [Magnetococcales bacterium]
MSRRERRRLPLVCVACRQTVRFAWRCRRCDFAMCQPCMDDNRWGMTCNNITWTCPDCGEENNYGNQ